MADRSLARSPHIVSVKYYTARVIYERDQFGETVAEIVAVQERMNPNHKFVEFAERNWHMFPSTPGPLPQPRINYSGMPAKWQHLLVRDATL